MDNQFSRILRGVIRGARLSLHLVHWTLLALLHPYLNQSAQNRIMKAWNRKLLHILNIGIQIEGQQPTRSEGGCLIAANRVSWLDTFVLCAINPVSLTDSLAPHSGSIASWLRRRSSTIFIARAAAKEPSSANLLIGELLKQGESIAVFPESQPTNGKHAGHFHSAPFQPAIDAGVRVCPIALRYQDEWGRLSTAAALTGEPTLLRSVWKILCARHINALVVFTPPLQAALSENRRVLARAAQGGVAQGLYRLDIRRHKVAPQAHAYAAQDRLSSQSSYALLIDPALRQLSR
ncbi:MAG TPA: lysophospholipid acyltransferase family protein [Gallionella sp.]